MVSALLALCMGSPHRSLVVFPHKGTVIQDFDIVLLLKLLNKQPMCLWFKMPRGIYMYIHGWCEENSILSAHIRSVISKTNYKYHRDVIWPNQWQHMSVRSVLQYDSEVITFNVTSIFADILPDKWPRVCRRHFHMHFLELGRKCPTKQSVKLDANCTFS